MYTEIKVTPTVCSPPNSAFGDHQAPNLWLHQESITPQSMHQGTQPVLGRCRAKSDLLMSSGPCRAPSQFLSGKTTRGSNPFGVNSSRALSSLYHYTYRLDTSKGKVHEAVVIFHAPFGMFCSDPLVQLPRELAPFASSFCSSVPFRLWKGGSLVQLVVLLTSYCM